MVDSEMYGEVMIFFATETAAQEVGDKEIPGGSIYVPLKL